MLCCHCLHNSWGVTGKGRQGKHSASTVWRMKNNAHIGNSKVAHTEKAPSNLIKRLDCSRQYGMTRVKIAQGWRLAAGAVPSTRNRKEVKLGELIGS